MITDTLIHDEVWADAPEDPEEAFLFIAGAAHARLMALSSNNADLGQHSLDAWRRQYIWEIHSVAEELGISGLPSADTAIQDASKMANFDARLARILTKIKASRRGNMRADAVTLTYQTKDNIRAHIEHLRALINASNLSEPVKTALHKKIDAVEAELNANRSGMKPFWILAGALTALSPIVGIFADLPDAINTTKSMVEMLHIEKAQEEARKQEIAAPLSIEHRPALQIAHQTEPQKK